MTDPLLAFFFVISALLALGVVFRRLKRVEEELKARQPSGDRSATDPAPGELWSEVLPELVRSPLLVILAQCELMRSTGPTQAGIEILERHARRIADLLDRERTARPAARERPVPIDPAACVREAAAFHAKLAEKRGVSLHLLIDETPSLTVKPALLRHALRHLVRAAILAAPRDTGDVTVALGLLEADKSRPQLAFAVADDGPGLEPEALARVFEPISGNAAGAGAPEGPELAYAVVHAMSHAIGAHFLLNTGAGIGTRATLKVPLRAGAEKAGKKEAPAVETGAWSA